MARSPPVMPPAVLLVGGLGTRLRHLTSDRPKAMVPIAGCPFLDWQVEALVKAGCTRVHLAAGHLAELLHEWMETTPLRTRAQLSLSVEPQPLGTGGGLAFAVREMEARSLLVVNGDTLLPALDLPNFFLTAAKQDLPVSLAVVRVENAARYGTIEADADHRVLRFLEKGKRGPGWINGGFYLLRAEALRSVSFAAPWSLETDWFPELAASRQLGSVPAPPPLLDMGTPEGLAEMEAYLRRPDLRPET